MRLRDVELLSLVMLASGFLCAHIVKLAAASLSASLAWPYESFFGRTGMMSIGGFTEDSPEESSSAWCAADPRARFSSSWIESLLSFQLHGCRRTRAVR